MGTGVLYDSGNYLYWGGPVSLLLSYLVMWSVLYAVMVHLHFECRGNGLEDVFARNDHSVPDPRSGLHDGESGVMSCNSSNKQSSWLIFLGICSWMDLLLWVCDGLS